MGRITRKSPRRAEGEGSLVIPHSLCLPPRLGIHCRACAIVHNLLAIAAAVLVSSHVLTAQAPTTGWFGVPLPAGLGDPHRPILDVATLKPAPATVPPGEDINRDLIGATIRKDLEAIVGFSKADRARGEQAWGRITGFRAADETHAWVLQQFTAAGLRDPETQTYTATQATWYPKSWSVKMRESGPDAPDRRPRIGVPDLRLATRARFVRCAARIGRRDD